MRKKYTVRVFDSKNVLPEIKEEDLRESILKDFPYEEVSIKEIPFDKTREQRNKDWVKEAFDLINWAGNWDDLSEELVEHISSEHRTLIQSFFRMIQMTIEGYAQHTLSDPRNENSLEWAKKVSKIDAYFPHI